MRKYEAIRAAQDCVTALNEIKKGSWEFHYKPSIDSPWQTSSKLPWGEAAKLRKDHLVRHARRLLGKPENYEEGKRNWTESI